MADMKIWEKVTIGVVSILAIGGVVYFVRNRQSSVNTKPAPPPMPSCTTQQQPTAPAPAPIPTPTNNANTNATKPHHLDVKQSSIKGLTLSGLMSSLHAPAPALPLAEQDISIGTALLFNFLLIHGNLSNAQSLQRQYWDAINANDANAMLNHYFAAVDELKAQWYNKQPSEMPQYLDHAKNAFNVLYAAAKIPGIVGSGTGNAVYYANSLINFVTNRDNGNRWTM